MPPSLNNIPRLVDSRRVLLPAFWNTAPSELQAALAEGGSAFLEFLRDQGLGPLWHHCLQANGLLKSLSPAESDALRGMRLAATAGYLAQHAELTRINRLLEREQLVYVVMKGVHVRECVYPEASLRSASDIDLLVSVQDRGRAAQILLDAGYTIHVDPVNISHEAGFSRKGVDIDLHWNMLRPGRTRIDMTAGLLARRQRVGSIWGLSDADTVFLMLTHPAFTKYVCSPNMGLARVADFFLWMQHRLVDWPAVVMRLESAGLKTAAWTMLSWFKMLAPPHLASVIDSWRANLRPGRLRAAYLFFWLKHDLPSRWLDHPVRIQLGMTLFLHDRPSDALHAWKGWRQSWQNRQGEGALFSSEIQSAKASSEAIADASRIIHR